MFTLITWLTLIYSMLSLPRRIMMLLFGYTVLRIRHSVELLLAGQRLLLLFPLAQDSSSFLQELNQSRASLEGLKMVALPAPRPGQHTPGEDQILAWTLRGCSTDLAELMAEISRSYCLLFQFVWQLLVDIFLRSFQVQAPVLLHQYKDITQQQQVHLTFQLDQHGLLFSFYYPCLINSSMLVILHKVSSFLINIVNTLYLSYHGPHKSDLCYNKPRFRETANRHPWRCICIADRIDIVCWFYLTIDRNIQA